ncbi:MAG: murein biosynthesis integral membrane protein MurJ [Caldiserica bacterium]|nr:murein biosynthesis integral membrane protein MurJ [Caldisericota bacterium]MDH7562165.1 murein biosynthesis integral membrane protein MurJ [Caldisericota bacterium]
MEILKTENRARGILNFLKRQTAAQAALLLTIISVISKPLGLLREIVIADFFGASKVTDAFFISQILPNVFGTIIAGALISAFIPVFIRVRETGGESEAWVLTSKVFSLLTLVLILICLSIYFFAGPVTRIMAPGFGPSEQELASWLVKFMIPTVFLGTLLGLFTAILNSYQHFLLPAAAALLNNVFLIVAVLLLAAKSGIVSLIIGSIGAVLFQFLIVGGGLLVRKPFLKLNFKWRDPNLSLIFKMVIPIVIGSSAGLLNLLVDRAIASGLPEASISALNYSSKIMGIPQGMFIANVATAIFPTLSLQVARNALEDFRRSLSRGLRALWYIILPSTAGLVFLASPIIATIYQHGAFTAEDTILTSGTLVFYSLGLFAHGGNSLLSNAFVSLRDTITPMKLGFLVVATNIVLNLLLSRIMGASGIALATSISAFLNFLLLSLLLQKKVGQGVLKGSGRELFKMIFASLIMGFSVYLLWKGIVLWLNPQNFWIKLFLLASLCGFGVIEYALLSLVFKIDEANRYLGYLKRGKEKIMALFSRRSGG